MVAIAEGIDHHDPDASKFFHILLIDGLGVGDIGKIANTERGDRIGTMHHSDRHDFKSVDAEVKRQEENRAKMGNRIYRLFIKAKDEDGAQIRFLTEGRKYTEYSFIGSSIADESWYNAGNWSIEINILDGGEW